MIRRPPRSTRKESSAASDVYKRQLFGAALIIGAPTVFLLLAFVSALMKTNGKMGGYREYETYGESSLNDAPPFLLPDPTNPKLSK